MAKVNKPIIKKLKNGFKVVYVPHRGVESVVLHLRGLAGSNYENKKQVGAAHLTEHLLSQISSKDKLLFNGANIINLTSRDNVLFMIKIQKKDMEPALIYLSDVFGRSTFDKNELEIQKNIVVEEIKRFENIPEKLVSRLSYKILYPHGRMTDLNTGDIKNVIKISTKYVSSFKHSYYTTENFILCFSGDLNPKKLFALAEKYFGTFPRKAKTRIAVHKKDMGLKVQCTNSEYFKQAHIKIDFYGYPLTNNKCIVSSLISKILDSHLKKTVRFQKGLVYNINCTSFSSGSYGVFSIYFASNQDKQYEILSYIIQTLNNVGRLINTFNLQGAKNTALSDLIFNADKTSFRADYYSESFLYGNPLRTYNKELKLIKNVNLAYATKVAKEIFKQNPKITVLSGESDPTKIKKLTVSP